MKREENHHDDHKLDDEQIAENLTDLVSIINANGDTKKIKKIIDENPTSGDNNTKKK
ncbi:hypothetical protein [Bacillus sp. FJAT-27245]|uniref:hypothetical protein n=1 Tax=Bacillus sp. FJAT-27245 TaxID=1684144 RepID=UPI000A7ED081|nr:hypothetical protein [Bacillus sp. FJAT-27245]